MAKTKAELIEDLNVAKATIEDLREQVREAEQLEYIHKEATKASRQLRAAMDAFKESGFTEEQAWELMLITMKTQVGLTV